MSALIRIASPEDAEPLARLYNGTLRDAYAGTVPPNFVHPVSEAERAAKLRAAISDGSRLWLVAIDNEQLVGACALCSARDDDLPPDFGEIATFAVDAAHRRRGYGLQLLDAARLEAVRHGWSALVLWVVASNAGARVFYARGQFDADGASRTDDRIGFPATVVRYRSAV